MVYVNKCFKIVFSTPSSFLPAWGVGRDPHHSPSTKQFDKINSKRRG